MSTKYIASNWRLPNEENSGKNDNYGLSFDGTEYVNSSDTFSALDGLTTLSFSGWIKPTTSSTSSIISIQDNVGYEQLSIIRHSSGYLIGKIYSGTQTRRTLTASPNIAPLNVWTHVAFTVDLSQPLGSRGKLYINGQNATSSDSTNQSVISTSGGGIFIGKRNIISDLFFTGNISEVAVFDYAFSEAQISTLYGSSSLGAGNPMALKPAPVAFYPLGDNSASNPLTQPNEAVEDASVFDFDGSDDRVSIPEFTFSSEFTLSMWINPEAISAGNTFILGRWNNNFDNDIKLSLSNNTPVITLRIGGSGVVFYGFTTSSTIPLNEWSHLLLIRNSTNDINCYLNGAQFSTTTGSSTNTLTLDSIGRVINNSYGWEGQLSNIAIWNSDQSSEISNIYNSGVPATSYTNTPTAWYKLDQSANWEATSTGNWQIPDAVSAYSQSFDLDDSSEEINFSTIDLGTEHTISMWVFSTDTTFGNIIQASNGRSRIILNQPNRLYYRTDDFTQVQNLSYPPLNRWNNIVILRNGTTLKFYVNKILKYTTESFAGTNFVFDKIIGISANLQGSNFQLWNTALTDGSPSLNNPATGQISELYNDGRPLTTAIASDNLKLWAKLDNTATWTGSAFSIPDSSGNGNTGTSSGMTEQNLINNNVSALNGESSGMTSANLILTDLTRNLPYDSYSFKFDSASSDYIELGTDSSLDIFGGDFSVSLWFNHSISSPNKQPLIEVGSFTNKMALTLGLSGNTGVGFAVGSGTPVWNYNAGTGYNDGNWHHMVATRTGTTYKIYVDNTELSFLTGAWAVGSHNRIAVGRSTPIYFDGEISNVSIFNEALTSTEVQKLYGNGMPQDLANFTPQPVAWWTLGSNSFYNGSNFICKDLIGSNDGTSVNAGVDAIVGDAPRSEANGTGTNMDIPTNLEGSTKWSSNNSWSINMSESSRVEDTP